jgi:hypothetical protein
MLKLHVEKFEGLANCEDVSPDTPPTAEEEFPTPVVLPGEMVAEVFQ